MTNIIFIGMMGSGKSTVSKLVSDEIDYKLFDMDEYIEELEGMKIKEIFKEKGELYFRDLEKKVIDKIKSMDKYIISTGGGAPINSNFKFLLKGNIIFYLKSSVDTLYKNLINATENRPLLDKDSLYEKLTKLLLNRESIYISSSNYVIECNNKSIEQIKDEILYILSVQSS